VYCCGFESKVEVKKWKSGKQKRKKYFGKNNFFYFTYVKNVFVFHFSTFLTFLILPHWSFDIFIR